MEDEEKVEELMEKLWIRTEEEKAGSVKPEDLDEADEETVRRAVEAGYTSLLEGNLKLTDSGRRLARSVIRRHRLAERLLTDVLGTGDNLTHEKACKFEHLLDRGLDESICSLLGHPRVCPHGKLIPPGNCCRQQKRHTQNIVAPLSQLNRNQRGRVAYIHAPESDQLQKLMAMGILPGAPINLVQSFPSYVFKVGQTQFAVDKEIADAIFVRLIETETAGEDNREELITVIEPERSSLRGRLGQFWPKKTP